MIKKLEEAQESCKEGERGAHIWGKNVNTSLCTHRKERGHNGCPFPRRPAAPLQHPAALPGKPGWV